MIRIILLDVDGVLVQPYGYRAALRATVRHFIGPDFEIQEELLNGLEKRGISSEWDMVPLLIAAYWNNILLRQPMNSLSSDVSIAAKEIQNRQTVDKPKQLVIPEFQTVAGQYPAETALRGGCFPSIPYGLRKNLLSKTRKINASCTMRIFQHFTLGSERFTETYQLPAEIESESFLLKYDISIIDDNVRKLLHQANHYLAAFTGRPSRPPREVAESMIGFAPEAELALELVGMQDIPLMAFGKLEYIAAQHGLDPVTLLKPSPVHALAGIVAAFTRDETSALQAAVEWQRSGQLNGIFENMPHAFELIVVEDTLGGIRSVEEATEICLQDGFDVSMRAFGITSGIFAKAEAFRQTRIPFFEDWMSLARRIEL